MPLPNFLKPFLPSYDISKMDLRDPYDKRLIIEIDKIEKLVKNQK